MEQACPYEGAGAEHCWDGREVGKNGKSSIRDKLVPPGEREDEIETSTAAGVGQLNGPRRQHLDHGVVPDDEHGDAASGGCRIFLHLT